MSLKLRKSVVGFGAILAMVLLLTSAVPRQANAQTLADTMIDHLLEGNEVTQEVLNDELTAPGDAQRAAVVIPQFVRAIEATQDADDALVAGDFAAAVAATSEAEGHYNAGKNVSGFGKANSIYSAAQEHALEPEFIGADLAISQLNSQALQLLVGGR